MERVNGEQEISDIAPATEKRALRIGILTISDRVSLGERDDLSGPAIQDTVHAAGFTAPVYAVIPDEKKQIRQVLARWADDGLCDCILTTGGTGLAERDVTPEATLKVLDQYLPALANYIALEGAKTIPTAVLSRGVAGARGATLIVNLPGSPKGARSGAELLIPIIPHAVEVLAGRGPEAHASSSEKAPGEDDADL